MKYQQRVVSMTKSACDGLVRSIQGMPEDKRTWKVMETGRSPMDLLQEVAQSLGNFLPMLKERKVGEFDLAKYEAMKADRQKWTTVEKCVEVLYENLGLFSQAVLDFPDENLDDVLHLPFAGGFDSPFYEIMMFGYWNAVYHLGQANFVQTLYGDWEMR